jgi:hypothetical protein
VRRGRRARDELGAVAERLDASIEAAASRAGDGEVRGRRWRFFSRHSDDRS